MNKTKLVTRKEFNVLLIKDKTSYKLTYLGDKRVTGGIIVNKGGYVIGTFLIYNDSEFVELTAANEYGEDYLTNNVNGRWAE